MPLLLPHPLALRLIRPADDAFLYELYASTRAEEMAATGWTPAQQQAFLRQQYATRRAAYRTSFPKAEHFIVSLDGKKIGTLMLHHAANEIRLVDLALIPSHRGAGQGSLLLNALLAEAHKARKPVHLHVLTRSRAFHLYSRLGFVPKSIKGDYTEMTWTN